MFFLFIEIRAPIVSNAIVAGSGIQGKIVISELAVKP